VIRGPLCGSHILLTICAVTLIAAGIFVLGLLFMFSSLIIFSLSMSCPPGSL